MRHRNQISNIVEKKNMNFNYKVFRYKLSAWVVSNIRSAIRAIDKRTPVTSHRRKSKLRSQKSDKLDRHLATHTSLQAIYLFAKKVVRQSAHSKQMSKMANTPKC